MNPQETHAAIVDMLRTSGLPMTTDNLNRAMQAVARGEMLQPQPDASAGIERSMQRVMQPRQLPIPPTPPVSLEQAVNTATGFTLPVIEQTPQAAAGDNPGIMHDTISTQGLPIDMILLHGMPTPTGPMPRTGPNWQDASRMLTANAAVQPTLQQSTPQEPSSWKYSNQPNPTEFTRRNGRPMPTSTTQAAPVTQALPQILPEDDPPPFTPQNMRPMPRINMQRAGLSPKRANTSQTSTSLKDFIVNQKYNERMKLPDAKRKARKSD